MNKNIFILILVLIIILPFANFAQKDKDLFSEKVFNGLKFRSVGPSFASGRISDIAVNPNNHSEIYVGVASGNVWKSINAGITWQPIFDNYGAYSIADVEIDPNNTNVVWVGTGEYNSQRAIGYGDGIYRSADGGKSFKNMGLKNSEHIGRIVIDPRNSDVYVACQGPLWGAGGDRGLYKTTDNGKTWKKILHISENTGITDIVFDSRNPDILYCASYQRRRKVFTLINGGEEGAIFKSTDAGATWDTLKNGLPSTEMGRIGLAISKTNPDYVYAIIEAQGESGGFFQTTNRGASWEKMNSHVSASPQYYNRIYVDPIEPNKVFSMSTYSRFSIDGGKNFNKINVGEKHVDDHALWIDPQNTNHFWLGTDGGLYETFDFGQNWRHIDGLPVTQFYRVAVDNAKPFYNIYGGTQDNMSMGGPSRTISSAGILNDVWFTTKGGDGFQSRVEPKNPDIVYSQSQYGWLVRYDKKSGESIIIKPQPPKDEVYRWNWNSPFIISSHSNTRLYFAANKLFKSDNRGDTWQVISPDLTRNLNRNLIPVMGKIQSPEAIAKNSSTSLYGNITEITESPLEEGLIYIGTDDGLIQVTEDGGKTWKKYENFPDIPKNTYISCLQASKHDANTVFATFDARKQNNLKPFVLKSTNRGKTWKNITSNLPERGTAYKIVQDHVNKNLLFVGTEFAFYFSVNSGEKWIKLSAGLPTTQIRDIVIQEDENDIVIATFGRGFYILDDYSPLRNINAELLNSKGSLFPVSDALMFIESIAKYGQGERYAAKNPHVAAVFTYYLNEAPQTLKQIRKKKEKELTEQGKNITYPTFEELQKEDEEEKPYLLFTITDNEGNIIRRLKKEPNSGINRITWDMKFYSLNPIDHKIRPFDTGKSGFPVPPGKYNVKLSLFVRGEFTNIGEEQTFEVKALQNNSLPRDNKKETAEFLKKTAILARAVFGTNNTIDNFTKKLNLLELSMYSLDKLNTELSEKIINLQKELSIITIKFRGNESISKRDANQVPSITDRLEILLYSFYRTTASPTTTMTEQYDIIAKEFEIELKKLKQIETEIQSIEKELEKNNAPVIPGNLPDWENE